VIENKAEGQHLTILEDDTPYSGLLVLYACDLANLFRRGKAIINFST